MSVAPRTEDRMRPWEMSWNGRTWHDMPGADFDIKKMNFYLYRMGHLKLEDVQYIGLDDVVRTRAVTVLPVSFGRMGLVRGLEEQAQRKKVQREVRRECVEEQMRVRAWKQGMQARLRRLKESRGGLRQLALSVGIYYDSLLKFVRTGKKLEMGKLQRISETLDAMAAGSFELKLGRRTKPVVMVPTGHVPFKAYVAAMASVRGLAPHSMYVHLKKHANEMPPIVKVHGRAWFVPESAMPEEVAA